MKTTHLFFVAVITATLLTQQAGAKIWRVNNKSNYNGTSLWGDNFGGTQKYPVFAQINQVVPLSASGDTIYVEASSIAYSASNIDRKLTIIGSGYFLSQNPHVSTTTDSCSIGQVNFNAGSEGSQIIGISNTYSYPGAHFYINVNNVTVKRCLLNTAIRIGSGLSDVYIEENYFYSGDGDALVANGTGYIYPLDLVFNNNICKTALTWGGSIFQCNNNTFDGPANSLNLSFTTSEFKNNILKSLNATTNINNGTNLNVSYSVGTSASQFGTANNNIVVASINSLFVSSASPDGMYQIANGSAADNSGSDGTDRGAFGGSVPSVRYTLSGLPPIPVIYALTTSGTATQQDGLSVTLSARTIK